MEQEYKDCSCQPLFRVSASVARSCWSATRIFRPCWKVSVLKRESEEESVYITVELDG